MFFDGEESFEEWTATDSLYGSRHLAERMAHTPHPLGSTHTNLLQAVVTINYVPFLHKGQRVCSYTDTHTLSQHYVALADGILSYEILSILHFFFSFTPTHVLHVIVTPFPLFWYTLDDTEENMHQPTVENLIKVLAEYLGF